jgi:hypothetical protein
MNQAQMSLQIVSSLGDSSGTSRKRELVLIRTNPPGLADSNEIMEDVGARLVTDDEVPLIMGFDIGRSR